MAAKPEYLALIVEDDESSILVLEQLLRQSHINSVVIRNGYRIDDQLEAIARPDVIFLDLEMPQVNGYHVLQVLQANPKFAHIPTVAYTTHTSHLNQAKRLGFHSFLGKPLDAMLFPDQLSRILNGEPVWEVG